MRKYRLIEENMNASATVTDLPTSTVPTPGSRHGLRLLVLILVGSWLVAACGGSPATPTPAPTKAGSAPAGATKPAATKSGPRPTQDTSGTFSVTSDNTNALLTISSDDFSNLIRQDVPDGKWNVGQPVVDMAAIFPSLLNHQLRGSGANSATSLSIANENAASSPKAIQLIATVYTAYRDARHGTNVWTQFMNHNFTDPYSGPQSVTVNGQKIPYMLVDGLDQGTAWSQSWVFYNNCSLLAALQSPDTSQAARQKMDRAGTDLVMNLLARLMKMRPQ